MIDIAAIDTFLSEQGQFCLVDWLLNEGHLAYTDYEAWRYAQLPFLTSACRLDATQLQPLVQASVKACTNLKLQPTTQEYYSWGKNPVLLTLCAEPELHNQLATRWLARRDIPQLDLFMDNSAAIAENQLLEALANRQINNAQAALERLSKLNAQHPKLGGYQDLVIFALHCNDTPLVSEDSFAAEWQGLLQEVAPKSKELLNTKSRDYLAVAWRRLATARQQFSATAFPPSLHASFAYAQIPDWIAVLQTLENETQLYQTPEFMRRLAEAYWQQRQLNAFYLIWGLLFDHFPEQAESLLNKKQRPLIEAWDDFLAFDDNWLPQEFLGYLFIRIPQLISAMQHLSVFNTAHIVQKANQAAASLMAAQIKEEDDQQARKNLKNTSPAMLRYYLKNRC